MFPGNPGAQGHGRWTGACPCRRPAPACPDQPGQRYVPGRIKCGPVLRWLTFGNGAACAKGPRVYVGPGWLHRSRNRARATGAARRSVTKPGVGHYVPSKPPWRKVRIAGARWAIKARRWTSMVRNGSPAQHPGHEPAFPAASGWSAGISLPTELQVAFSAGSLPCALTAHQASPLVIIRIGSKRDGTG